MEQSYEDLKLHSVTKFIKYKHLLRRTSLQFVLSVLVFISLFLLYYSSGIFKFPHEYSFNVYLSTLLFSRLTHNLVERKYMFLIFNGILAFLAKSTSSSSSASSPLESTTRSDHVDVETNKEACGGEVVHEQADYPNGSDLYADEEEVVKSVDFAINDQYKQDDQEQDYDEEEEEEEENLEIHHVGSNIKQQEGEGGQIGEIGTEELNRKIEEFIRKMKEEIRIEAQHQLIAV